MPAPRGKRARQQARPAASGEEEAAGGAVDVNSPQLQVKERPVQRDAIVGVRVPSGG